ncbi:MAG: Gfo/Idh/MocA family protein [Eubacteriales bacterium]|jgi:UDP-N-acetyl-2-amino-2-deoxyglucuronate dehydrogenase
MNYALIGCGRISVNHIKAARENQWNIVAICDIFEEGMKTFRCQQELKSDVKSYRDYREMLAEEKIDVVSITVKSGLHAQIALDCMKAGVHVIIEKPLALSLEEADAVIACSNETGMKAAVCHQNRFYPSVQFAKRAMEKGKFGKLSHGAMHVRWNRGEVYYREATWRGTWQEDGGTMMNQCIHSIDIFRWLMGGEIEEVFGYTARQLHPYIETEDVALAVIKFQNGAIGTIEASVNVYPKNLEETLYLFGEKGTVKLGGKSLNTVEHALFEKAEGQTEPAQGLIGHSAVFADMKEAIEQSRAPYIDAREGRAAIELILAIHQSAKEKRPVRLPLKSGKCIDYRGMF